MNPYVSQLWRRIRIGIFLGVFLSLTGCASVYVDGNSPEIPATQFKKPVSAQPAQLIFEFKTKGIANVAATDLLKEKVAEQIEDSGLFSKVSANPVEGGSLLTLSINNIALTDDAAAKGFVAGLTFGIAGQTVADGYEWSLSYFGDPKGNKPTVVKQGKHVIYTSIGSSAPPSGAIKTDDTKEAVFLMVKQSLSRLLSELSLDPQFNR